MMDKMVRVKRVYNAVQRAFESNGYRPTDPEVGKILRSMLISHEILVEAAGKKQQSTDGINQ